MITAPVFGAYSVQNGLFENRPLKPKQGDMYIATDTKQLLICFEKVGFDISTAVFSQSISTQDTFPVGITFNSDGSKLYEVGVGSEQIYEYDLAVKFDISTAIFSQSINTQDGYPRGITFNSDGSKLYEVGSGSKKIYEYDLSVKFDISTAIFSQSISTQDIQPRGITFNSDGSKLYEVGLYSEKIYEYDLAVKFDISTAVFSQSINTQDTNPSGITFNSDGSKLYEVGSGSNKIYEYDLAVKFDISTAIFSQSISTQDTFPVGITFNSDGLKLYEMGSDSNKIYEYILKGVGQWEEYKTTPDMSMTSEDYTFEDSEIPLICSGSNLEISETEARTGTKCLKCSTRPYGSTPGDGSDGTAYGIEVLKISSLGLQEIELFFKSPDTDYGKTLSVKFYDEEHNLLQEFPHPSDYIFFKSENKGNITVEMDVQWMSLSNGRFSLYVDDLKVVTLV